MVPAPVIDRSGGGLGSAWGNQKQSRQSQLGRPSQINSRKPNEQGQQNTDDQSVETGKEGPSEDLLLEKLPSFFESNEDPKQLLLKKLKQCLVILEIPVGYTINVATFQKNNASNIGTNANSPGMFMNKKGGSMMKMGKMNPLYDSLGDKGSSDTIRKDYLIYNKIMTLLDIRDFLRTSPSGIYTKEVCADIIEVVKANIFRITVKMKCKQIQMMNLEGLCLYPYQMILGIILM